MDDQKLTKRTSERLWMGGLWLFFVAWLLGVALWKAPGYAQLYHDLSVQLPPVTKAILLISTWISRFWFLAVPLLLVPLVLIACGAFDRRTGPFTAVMIVVIFLLVSLSTLFLFMPTKAIFDKIQNSSGLNHSSLETSYGSHPAL